MMKKTLFMKILIILMIITTLFTFLGTMPVYAAGAMGEFYYMGTTSSSYSVGKSFVSKLVNALSAIADYVLGLMTMGFRIVLVGWAELFEWALVRIVDSLCKTNMATSDEYLIPAFEVFQSITDVDNRVTIEKIVFNKLPIFDVNFFVEAETGENNPE